VLHQPKTDRALGLEFSPDGRWLASGVRIPGGGPSESFSVTIWEVETGRAARSLPRMNGLTAGLAWSPDGRLVAAGTTVTGDKGGRPELKVFEAATGRTVYTLEGSVNDVFSLAFSGDSRRLVSCSGKRPGSPPRSGEVIVWDMATGLELLRAREPGNSVYAVAISPSGRYLATGRYDGTVLIQELRPVLPPEAPAPRIVAR
ncbi:MAG TPA: hypothetical protein VKE74_28425, partial [Gemmataceae bacterium]|nr:hypothetical protein [Gemmataceae bacterium]